MEVGARRSGVLVNEPAAVSLGGKLKGSRRSDALQDRTRVRPAYDCANFLVFRRRRLFGSNSILKGARK